MRTGPALIAALALAITACSGETGGNASNTTDSNAATSNTASAAVYDPNSEQGRAYRALLECAATAEYAKGAVGGESMFVQGEELAAMRAREAALRATSTALQGLMRTQGTALGLTTEAITAEFNAHQQTLLHGPGMGTRAEHAQAMAQRAETCAANYPGSAS
ncbi:MAG: hypothetical protein AB7O91_01740 [Sphingomonas sp.]